MLWMVLALAVATAAAYYRWSRRRLYQLAKEIPSGLREYPIVGHAYIFLGTSEDRMEALQKLGLQANRQAGLSHVWLANRLYISMTDAKSIEIVSKACLDKDEFTMKYFRTFLGNGSITAPVNIWHPRRRMLAPFFRSSNLKLLIKVFDEQSNIMTKLMRSEVDKGDFPIWKYFTTYSLDTVFETAIGIKLNSQVDGDHWILRVIDECTTMVSARCLQPWLHPDFIYKRLPVYRQLMEHKKRVYDHTHEILQNKRKELAAAESNAESKNGAGDSCMEDTKNNFATGLETIIRSSEGAGKGYSDIEICEEGIVFITAGNDTSAVGAGFTSVMLSRHPDVQDRLYQELEEVFGDSDRAVTAEDLPRLKYLEAVIKESLRLYPPVPVVMREVHNDVVLPSGTTLVDGTSIMFNIWGTHRNPAYWGADAEQFRPERFLEGPLLHPAQFIPFSYSFRSCVGGTYAMLSAKTALANLLRRYRLLPPANMAPADLRKPLRIKFDVMMKAVDNFIVRVEKRH